VGLQGALFDVIGVLTGDNMIYNGTTQPDLTNIAPPKGVPAIACETCGQVFNMATEEGQRHWDVHRELSASKVAEMQALLPQLFALVGRDFRMIYLSRLDTQRALGFVDVKIKGVKYEINPCLGSTPELILNRPVPVVEGSYAHWVHWVADTNVLPLPLDEVLQGPPNKWLLNYTPCGDGTEYMEDAVSQVLHKGVDAPKRNRR
jgi:hypothetical protein